MILIRRLTGNRAQQTLNVLELRTYVSNALSVSLYVNFIYQFLKIHPCPLKNVVLSLNTLGFRMDFGSRKERMLRF